MIDTKILVLDIDGTLTNSQKEITEVTKESIRQVQHRGHVVILASGRPTAGMKRYVDELEMETYGGYTLSYNGGKIINCRTGEIVFQKVLPNYIIPGLYRFAKENDCGICTYLGDTIISGNKMDKYMEMESRINGIPIKEVDNFATFVDFDVNKCLLTAEPEKAEVLVEQLKEKFGDILSIYRSEPFFIEVMPKNVDKATSLDRMLSSIGLTRENTICCGDGFNDMTMIMYAGVGVAMENAQPAVKEVADFITKSNDEDGIAHVIDKFIFD